MGIHVFIHQVIIISNRISTQHIHYRKIGNGIIRIIGRFIPQIDLFVVSASFQNTL